MRKVWLGLMVVGACVAGGCGRGASERATMSGGEVVDQWMNQDKEGQAKEEKAWANRDRKVSRNEDKPKKTAPQKWEAAEVDIMGPVADADEAATRPGK